MRLRATSLAVALLAGCVTIPDGPGILALPGTGRTFEQFRADEADCRQYASAQIGGQKPNQAAVDSGVASAAVGTAVGAVAGGALGGSQGAAAGAGVGLAAGALAGTGAGQASGRSLQQRYDFAYQQCMYAKGHKVPVAERIDRYGLGYRRHIEAPPRYYPPPPPPGPISPAPPTAAPPPPPGAVPPPPPPSK